MPRFRSRESLAARGNERLLVADHVIGSKRQHDRVRVARPRAKAAPAAIVGPESRRISSSSTPASRPISASCDHVPKNGRLLAMHLARGRPQPRSGTPAHDRWNNSSVHRHLKPRSSRDSFYAPDGQKMGVALTTDIRRFSLGHASRPLRKSMPTVLVDRSTQLNHTSIT
jgi:hypothetical protein